VFNLVVSPKGSLGGDFSRALPWIIGIVGGLLSLIAALVGDRLANGRRAAEQLAGVLDRIAVQNRELYAEQRGIAQTLQHALLPEELPEVAGIESSFRYVPAASGIEVGGDWFDLIAVDERRTLMVIGDVSGHGLKAATTMAALRHATLAYAVEDPNPATVLAKLSDYVNRGDHDHFATLLCALLDVEAHRLSLASAGHLPPLLIEGGQARFLLSEVGVPIGVVARDGSYETTEFDVPVGATLLAYTDGLVERRGETLDVGLERLRATAVTAELPLDDLLVRLGDEMATEGHTDDTAILGVRWLS
jgi:serine phosphatase RsbU (regulator of sigma subunit)